MFQARSALTVATPLKLHVRRIPLALMGAVGGTLTDLIPQEELGSFENNRFVNGGGGCDGCVCVVVFFVCWDTRGPTLAS